MQDEFLKLYDTLTDEEKQQVVYRHPDFDVPVTWNEVKYAIDNKTVAATMYLNAFVNAGIIKQ